MILLGNLTVEQMEKRCGITLKDEERNALDALREETCDKVCGNNKMHIYDIPFLIECGNPEARKAVIDILTPYAGKIIEPRKPTDRGGYICMPLKKNVPESHADWKPAKCPVCGRECWTDPARELLVRTQGAIPLCTECALGKGERK